MHTPIVQELPLGFLNERMEAPFAVGDHNIVRALHDFANGVGGHAFALAVWADVPRSGHVEWHI